MCRPPAAMTVWRNCFHSSRIAAMRWAFLLGRHALVVPEDGNALLDVAAKHDVGTATGHVGGDRDHAGTPACSDDLGFPGVRLAFST